MKKIYLLLFLLTACNTPTGRDALVLDVVCTTSCKMRLDNGEIGYSHYTVLTGEIVCEMDEGGTRKYWLPCTNAVEALKKNK